MTEKTQFTLRSLLKKEKVKFDGSNFIDWYRNVRVLKQESKDKVMKIPSAVEPTGSIVTQNDRDDYTAHSSAELQVQGLLLSSMESELQKRFEYELPYDIMLQLKKMFQEQAHVEKYNTVRSLVGCKLAEGKSVSMHILKMIGYLQHLDILGAAIDSDITVNLVFNSYPSCYSWFILNYHMHGMEKSLDELHGMLKTAELDMKKGNTRGSHVLVV